MKIDDFNPDNLRILKAGSDTTEFPLTSIVPPGYSIIVPTVINPLNKRPFPYGYVIRRDGVFKLSGDSVMAYARHDTTPRRFKSWDGRWESNDAEAYAVDVHECLFVPVLPASLLGERDCLPLRTVDDILPQLALLGRLPQLYSLLHASDSITAEYSKQMLQDVQAFKSAIPPGIALAVKIPAPYSLIVLLSKDVLTYATESIKAQGFALGVPESTVATMPPYVWIQDAQVDTTVLPCIIPTILEPGQDLERILAKDVLLLHSVHYYLSRFKAVPTLLNMLPDLSTSQLKHLSEHLLSEDPVLSSVLACEHNKRIDQEISELEQVIENKRKEYLQKPIK